MRYKEEIFCSEGGETLEQVEQRGSRGPIPRNIQVLEENEKEKKKRSKGVF